MHDVVAPAVFFAIWLLRPSAEQRTRFLKVGLPCVAVLAVGAIFLGLHNRAVTGDPWRSGYVEYESKAPGAPPFIWQDTTATPANLRITEQVRLRIDLGDYREMRRHWLRTMLGRATTLTLDVYLPHAAFALLLLLAPFGLRDWRERLAASSAIPVIGAIGVSSFYLPAYVGPAVPPLVLAYVAGCGVLCRWSLGRRPVGRAALAAVLVMMGALGAWRVVHRGESESEYASPIHWTRKRAAVEAQLAAQPGKHLVFVRYGEQYRSQNEWVQNGADIHGAKLVWAHDRGKVDNEELLRVESDRTVWLLIVDGRRQVQLRLRPYASLESELD